MKKVFFVFLFLTVLVSTANAQGWTNEGSLADTSYNGGAHGVAVDPDGKIWTADYYQATPIIDGTDTAMVSPIFVFNADGSAAAFSPIYVVGTDTVNGNCRGMGVDENGNIVFVQSGPGKMMKFNYQTGAVMGTKLLDEPGSSPTAPSISDDGTIYVGPVVGGGTTQIAMYDTDLNYLGSAVDGPPAISRTLEVSSDGLSIYWMPFTAKKTFVYTRADEFSAFELTDSIHIGMNIESSTWHPVTGQLWVSNDSRSADITKANLTWYAYDVDTKTFVDALQWDTSIDPEGTLVYPRGIDFTPDGNSAYLGVFRQSGDNPARIQKVSMTPVGVERVNDLLPNGYELSQNYPNPFNPTTKINFSIPEAGLVTVKVFDILGQEVAELINEVRVAGSYKVDFDASQLSSGMYIYRISAGNFKATKKMMLLK